MFVKDNLRLHKSHLTQFRREIGDLHNVVSEVKEDNKKNLEARISYDTMANIRSKLHQDSSMAGSIVALDKRVSDVECQLNQVLINQNIQQKLLLTLLQAQNIPIPDLFADYKKGEKNTTSTAVTITSAPTTSAPTATIPSVPSVPSSTTTAIVNPTTLPTTSTNKCLQLRGSHQLRGSNLL